jgi:hypothetical protein
MYRKAKQGKKRASPIFFKANKAANAYFSKTTQKFPRLLHGRQ